MPLKRSTGGHKMGLPFQPEPIEKLAVRYQKAMEKVYDADKITQGQIDRPGLHRENVFDFEDGIRLIISKDRTSGRLYIHISGSSTKGPMSGAQMLKEMLEKFMELRKEPLEGVAEASASGGGIIHVIIRINEDLHGIPPGNPKLN